MAIPVTVTVDDTLKAKLTEYLDHLEAGIKQGGDFVAKEAPDVVNQMVAYNLGIAIAWCVLALSAMIASKYMFRWIVRQLNASKEISDNDKGFLGLLSFLFLVMAPLLAGTLVIANNLPTILKCWLAPKYFILEQIIALVK